MVFLVIALVVIYIFLNELSDDKGKMDRPK